MPTLIRRSYTLPSVNRSSLDAEIRDSIDADLVDKYQFILFEVDKVVAYFDEELSVAEQMELDSIMAAHSGVPPSPAELIELDPSGSTLVATDVGSAIHELASIKQDASEKGQPLGYASLDASGKVPSAQLPSALDFKGVWNADLNVPNLTTAAPLAGDIYVVSVAGSTDLDGVSDWQVKDWAVYNGASWEKVDNTDSVSAVFGRTGAVVAAAGDYTASQVSYSNVSSGLPATNVQESIDDLDARVDDLEAAPVPDNDSVKVSATDTIAGFLTTKLLAGTNITLTPGNIGANETLTIDAASGPVAPDFPFANLHHNSNLTFDSGPVTLAINQASPELDTDFYTLTNSQLTIVQSGTYAVYYGTALIADGSNGNTAYDVWLEVNNAERAGSRRSAYIPKGDKGNSCSDLTIGNFTAGDTLRIRSEQSGGNRDAVQRSGHTRLLVVRLGD